LASVLLAALLLAPAGAQAADKVRLQLQWVHQAQFAGFYLAQDLGLYGKAGLEVEIKPGGPGLDPLIELAAGRCDFALSWLSEALQRRGKGVPLLNLAQLVQRSSLLLVTFADSSIKNIKDLQGKRVGLWSRQFALAPRALFHREGVRVQEVPQNVTMAPFLMRAVDAASAMLYNEYHQLYQAGVDLNQIRVFDFVELGLNFPEDGLYALNQTWAQRPEICRRFVAASLEGWHQAFAQPEKALAAVMKRVDASHLASNQAHQRWMLNTMQKLITNRVGLVLMGQLSSFDLKMVNQVLVQQGFLPAPVPLEEFAVPAWKAP
jgi:NitT/TauT family transport system substrate-binding protein